MLFRYALAATLAMISLPAAAQTGHRIEVSIKNYPGQQLLLAHYFANKQYITDTAYLREGRFVFEGQEPLPGGIYLVALPPKNNYFEIVLDQDQVFSVETDTVDLVKAMKVKGSTENELFYQHSQYLGAKWQLAQQTSEKLKAAPKESPEEKALRDQLTAVDQEIKAYRLSFMNEHPELFYTKVLRTMQDPEVPEPPKDENGKTLDSLFTFKYYRAHYLDNVDFADGRLLRTPVLFNKVNTYIEKLTYRVPDSIIVSLDYIFRKARANDEIFQFVVSHFFNQYATSKYMGMDKIWVHIAENYYLSGEAWWADEEMLTKMRERVVATKPTLLDNIAPDFRVQDAAGTWHSVHGTKADYILLYFWDYDCGHCKKITPKLAEAFKQYQGKNVKLLAVSINGDVEVWKKKISEYGLDQPQIINVQDHYRRSGFDGMYDIRSTPRLFIVDKDKKLIAKMISVHGMQEILNPKFGLPVPPKPEGDEDEAAEDE